MPFFDISVIILLGICGGALETPSKAMSAASGYAPRAIVAPIVGAVYKNLGGS